MIILTVLLALFFSLNMGGASFAASFAAAYGGKIVSRLKANILFLFFVILGAVVFGENVSVTLGKGITPLESFPIGAFVIIFLAAGLSMFVSNVMKIPQSTSLVTVAAIAGVGLYYSQLNVKALMFLLPIWFILPILSFVLTYILGGYIYPPRKINFWIYEKLVNQKERLKIFVIVCSCYNAFSVGTNNVANVAGPLESMGLGNLNLLMLLALFGVAYGLGSFVFNGALKTAGDKIVPLGLMTASIISLVSGTLMILASIYGIPQSFVMLQVGAIFAVSSLKHGSEITFSDPITKKTLYTWTINPIITLFMSYGLAAIFLKG